MAANTSPVFTAVPNVGAAEIGATGAFKSDGTGTIGTDMIKVYTAGNNGDWINTIRFTPVASVSSGVVLGTVLRTFLSTQGAGSTTNANTFLLFEQAVPTTTVANQLTGISYYETIVSRAIPSGYNILCSSAVSNASNTNWTVVVFGGSY